MANEYSRDMREVERKTAGIKEKPEMWDLWTAQDEMADRCTTGNQSWDNVMPLSAIRTYETGPDTTQDQDVKRKLQNEIEKEDDIPDASRCQITMAIAMPSPRNHRPLERDNGEGLEYCIGVMEVPWDIEKG